MARFSVKVKNLMKGLRPSKRNPRNNGFLTTCAGMVGRDGVLQAIDPFSTILAYPMQVIGTDRLNYTCIADHVAASTNIPVTGVDWATYWSQSGTDGEVWVDGKSYMTNVSDGFPYPQIFEFRQMTIVCGKTDIYEWVDSALVLRLSVAAGQTWRALDFNDFIYMTNGVVSVTRDPLTKLYSVSDQPPAYALCNYNGQVVIGSPPTNYWE
jgi:hypothetical protein